MKIDLSQCSLPEVVECPIVSVYGQKTTMVILLAGPGHPARIDLDRKLSAKALRQFNRTGKASLPDDPEELRQQETERMVVLTVGWRGFISDSGEEVPFSEDNARAVYESRDSGIRGQVARALADIANFTVSSSVG